MIQLHDITKRFTPGNPPAVDAISFRVNRGETVVLLGTSGCGKTTTLKMINRLVEPSAGAVTIDEQDTRDADLLALRRSIGYVFQDIGLFPHLTVRQNVQILPRLLGWPKQRQRARADELLERVGLDPNDHAARRPRELSGGQQQRVGIARALATDPDYLLMDEPFGALDAVTRDKLQAELIRLATELNKTILFVTHDIFEALRLGDRIGVMNRGRLDQIDTPANLIANPATDFVRQLFDQASRQAALLDRHDP